MPANYQKHFRLTLAVACVALLISLAGNGLRLAGFSWMPWRFTLVNLTIVLVVGCLAAVILRYHGRGLHVWMLGFAALLTVVTRALEVEAFRDWVTDSLGCPEPLLRHFIRPSLVDAVFFVVLIAVIKMFFDLSQAADSAQQQTRELEISQSRLRLDQKLLRMMLDTHERDRRLTAYEIHDGLVQQMTGALMHLQAATEGSGLSPDQVAEETGTARRLLRRSIDEARRLISGLRPPILDEQGMVAAIDYLIRERAESDGLDVEFTHRLSTERFSPLIEVTVFRIVQEALANVAQHAKTNRASVRLEQQPGALLLDVSDRGVGFDPALVSASRFGIQGILERTRLLGGTADIDSQPGRGTHVSLRLPIDPAADGGRPTPSAASRA